MNKATHRPCVSIIITRKNEGGDREVLLVHKPRKNDAWQIPQGGIEEGESIAEAAARELSEETGIHVPPEAFSLQTETYQYDYPEGFKRSQKPKYKGQHLSFVTAEIDARVHVKIDGRELDAFLWVPPQGLQKYLKRKNYRGVVERLI
jgi:putative (di)nucleoside polyphosphate hydrolase